MSSRQDQVRELLGGIDSRFLDAKDIEEKRNLLKILINEGISSEILKKITFTAGQVSRYDSSKHYYYQLFIDAVEELAKRNETPILTDVINTFGHNYPLESAINTILNEGTTQQIIDIAQYYWEQWSDPGEYGGGEKILKLFGAIRKALLKRKISDEKYLSPEAIERIKDLEQRYSFLK